MYMKTNWNSKQNVNYETKPPYKVKYSDNNNKKIIMLLNLKNIPNNNNNNIYTTN